VNVTYEWLGNKVIAVDPAAKKTPIFSPEVRILPPPPAEVGMAATGFTQTTLSEATILNKMHVIIYKKV
jgi:hypothetical protein